MPSSPTLTDDQITVTRLSSFGSTAAYLAHDDTDTTDDPTDGDQDGTDGDTDTTDGKDTDSTDVS
jgi:hypothetical protein